MSKRSKAKKNRSTKNLFVNGLSGDEYSQKYDEMLVTKAQKRKKLIKKILLIVLCVLLALAIIAASVFAYLYYSGKGQLKNDKKPSIPANADVTNVDENTIIFKGQKYKFDEILYVVGNEQTLHFEQLKRVLSKMGYDSNKLKHISFGLMLQNGKKMSTRGGTGLNLQDLLDSSISLANKYIEEKNPTLKDKEEVSKKIGVGAVIFNDLKNYRVNDIDFNLEETLSFTGNTGPYIQYTNARINSLLEHYKENDINYDEIDINDTIWNVIFDLYEFPEVVVKSKDNYDPSEIAKYLLNLSSDFNKMYANVKIIDNNNNKTNFNLALSKCVGVVLTEGMRLLGIKMPNKM